MVIITFISPQPVGCKTMDTGLVHQVVCLFTLQFPLVLINQPWRDGTLSWHLWTHDPKSTWPQVNPTDNRQFNCR